MEFLVLAPEHTSREILHHLEVVCGHQHSSAFPGKFMKELDYMVAGLGVEIAGRFVGQYKFRTVKQRPCNHNALLLATAQFMRHLISLVVHAYGLEHLLNPGFHLIFRPPPRGPQHKPEVVDSRTVLKSWKS